MSRVKITREFIFSMVGGILVCVRGPLSDGCNGAGEAFFARSVELLSALFSPIIIVGPLQK